MEIFDDDESQTGDKEKDNEEKDEDNIYIFVTD